MPIELLQSFGYVEFYLRVFILLVISIYYWKYRAITNLLKNAVKKIPNITADQSL